MTKFFSLLTLVGLTLILQAQEILQFRGLNATGYFESSQLLDVWPEDGPELLFEAKGIGNGYGSPAITQTKIFVNGEIDSLNYLFALDKNGQMLWQRPIGYEWVETYPGSRTAPTVVGNLVYVTAGMGAVVCFDSNNGDVKWKKDMINDFNGVNTRFGFSESIMHYKDWVFCLPGGKDTNIVALNRFNGDIEWICSGLGEMPSYCSPLVLELENRTLLINFSKSNLLGIDAITGELLWTHEQEGDGDVHVNTPLYDNGYLYYVTGDGNGAVKLKLSNDGTQIKEIWRNKRFDNLMGGFIKIDDYLYASGFAERYWYSLHAETGEIQDSVRYDKGITIYADGKLFLYNERGRLGMFRVQDGKFTKISDFRLTLGSKAHFSHPVVSDGILYIRRGESLMAYDLRKK